jgi:NADH-quinone oxidoreductase subunit G
MDKFINLKIDGRDVSAPAGTMVVDAAKMAGITIPVFCHHPKLEPVGMCRMCLVDIGRPAVDRATGKPVLNEDGTPNINFGPKLETACTTPVSEGMVVWGATEKVMAARKDVLELLLTSHPLDCPVCDKGGECPLQNETMEFGPSESRFIFDEKNHLEKHVALGELIFLDRERCIQCARCVRFSDQLAGDPVIGFYQRGRQLEIVTYSEPGFDSIFSGNTTDICPVGALTTADFRFGARPWEMSQSSSICTHCPVGCNISYSVRREAKTGGNFVVKRVLPRQNEAVNELWICDKGRFGYHYAEDPERITKPLIRKDGKLVPVSWEKAIKLVSGNFKTAGKKLITLAGGNLANEDLFALKQLSASLEGKAFSLPGMGGAEWTTRMGLTPGSNLASLGKGSAVLVFASDLHEEAPIWWLRLKSAAERGATVIVAAARQTRLEKHAAFTLRYKYGEEEKVLKELISGKGEAAKAFASAADAVVFYGNDGLDLQGSGAVAGLCAELLVKTSHFDRPNNGLVAVWPGANDQGAAELGWRPSDDLVKDLSTCAAAYICAADPAGQSPELAKALQKSGFVVVQDLFLTETAKLADVVLPAAAVMEREGTFVSGERRVQRFHPAVKPAGECRADFEITAVIADTLELKGFHTTAEEIFTAIASSEPSFTGLSYQKLGQTEEQWPVTGRPDAYYSGNAVANKDGLGVTLALSSTKGNSPALVKLPELPKVEKGAWLALPVNRLFDQGAALRSIELLKARISGRGISLHPADAEKLGLSVGDTVALTIGKEETITGVDVDPGQPQGVVLVRRSMGLPVFAPAQIALRVPAAAKSEIR